ncbi:rhodanese-like domain-containing protein [uncultured Shimia sp.]|uniref:rhodanese-like domain-containing protein n=1 Tax=uncultured Shimia sp. TaxID=573152 RepID=UPI0025DD655C|nr:rhodanese-like domain-containing protein [uncultured Shimia sp.]
MNMNMLTRRSFVASLSAASLAPSLTLANPTTLSASDAHAGLKSGNLILIDVRTPQEWQETGVAEGAWPLDMREEAFGSWILATLERNPTHQVAIICRSGNRSGRLMQLFSQNGIKGVLDVSEGMLGGSRGKGWIPTDLPVVSIQEAYNAMPKDLTIK